MIIKAFVLSLTAAIGLSGCGIETGTQEEVAEVQEETPQKATHFTVKEKEALDVEFAALPKGLIYRVPVDTEGNELTGQAEVRAYAGPDLADASSGDSAWDIATQTENLDEIDNELSLRRGNRHNGGVIEINYTSDRDSRRGRIHRQSHRSRFWRYFPRWYSHYYPGYWTYYSMPYCYPYGGYRYYYYPRPVYW